MQLSPDEVLRENTKRSRRTSGQAGLALDPSNYSRPRKGYDEILQVGTWIRFGPVTRPLAYGMPITAQSRQWHSSCLGLK